MKINKKNKKKITPRRFTNLSAELHAIILSQLNITQLKPLLFANRECNKIITNNHMLWSKLYGKYIYDEKIDNKSPTTLINKFKERYLNYEYVKYGIDEVIDEFEIPGPFWIQMLYDNETDILYTASTDNNITAIQDINVIGVFVGHKTDVTNFKIDRNFLVSVSKDNTIKIWNKKTYVCLHTLTGHKSQIEYLDLYNEHIVTCSWDTDIRIGNYKGELVHLLREHNTNISCIDLHKNLMVSGSVNGNVLLWDYKEGILLGNLKKHNFCVTSVTITRKYIAYAGTCCTINVFSIKNKFLHELKGHDTCVDFTDIIDDILISSSANKCLTIAWDLNTGKKLYDIQGIYGIKSLKHCNNILMICTIGTCSLFDFKTGVFIRTIFQPMIVNLGAVIAENIIYIASTNVWDTNEITQITYKKLEK